MAFYHVRITRKSQRTEDLVELDLSGPGLMKNIVNPYLQGKTFYCENTTVDPFDVETIKINTTTLGSSILIPQIHARREEEARRTRVRVAISDRWYVTEEGEDVTRHHIKHPPMTDSTSKKLPTNESVSKKVFVVHGHDEVSKLELARLITKMGLNPIILHEQPNKGKTIIEKFEENASDVGYAFVILTADDLGGPTTTGLRPRARQNVVLELGFFMGKLGRGKVCCLYKGDMEIPSDMHGIAYYKFNDKVGECLEGIMAELKAAGYRLTL